MNSSRSRHTALDLSQQRILITGGSGALGVVIADTLRAHGATVTSIDLESGINAADPASVDGALDTFVAEHDALPTTVLCHAGIVGTHSVLDYPIEEFDRIIESNLKSAYVTARQVARRWKQSELPGHLIFTSSWVARTPWPEIGPYTATKAAIEQLMRQFALELSPHNIRANAMAPGIVAAGMAKHQWDTDSDYRRRASVAVPLGLQEPQSVADAFLFLCSGLASYMNGSVLTVDGGASLRPME